MMMRPFPLSSPNPHLTANEKHDNYLQVFSPRSSAAVISVMISSQLIVSPTMFLPLSHMSVHSLPSIYRGVGQRGCSVTRVWLESGIWCSFTHMGQWGTDKGYVEGNEQWIKGEQWSTEDYQWAPWEHHEAFILLVQSVCAFSNSAL